MIGSHIGRFRITAPLGRGGIATVWRAHDPMLDRDVALKLLSQDLSESTKARRRFVHEAISTAKLSHPGIVGIIENGEHEGRAYIAYALIDGDTVSELASRRRMPVAEVVRIAIAAADALAHAHSFGVIHRDVTGRNIMVARDGRVIVLDFGLALAVGMTRLTTSERTVGTVAYMSPEATLGQDCDARSDLYGLGIVMYEMLTGRFPFPGDRPESMIYAKLNVTPEPPSVHRPEIREALDGIVVKAIARDPQDRFANAGELLAALRALDVSPSSPQPSPPRPVPVPAAPRVEDSAPVTRPHPLYLAVLPFEIVNDADVPEGLRAHLARIAEPLNAMLSKSSVRPVAVTGTPAGELRDAARALGANAMLRGCAIVSGTRVRATWGVVDPESGVQWAGDVVEGSAMTPFELEDRVVASVARGLGIPPPSLVERMSPRPSDPAAADRMMQALRHLERYDQETSVDGAIAILEQLIASEGESAPALAALTRACLYKHRLTRQMSWVGRAANACDRAIAMDPESPDALVALGDVHYTAGRLLEAISDYGRALGHEPGSIEARVGLSHAREDSGDLAGSERDIREAIAMKPEDWRTHFRLAGLLFAQGRYEESLSPAAEVVRRVPDNPRGWRLLGNAHFNLDRFEDAASAYRRSLEIQPSVYAHTNLATVLYYSGESDESIRSYERAVALNPADPIAWGNFGSACRWLPGHRERAREPLDRAVGLMRDHLALDPADAEGWSWLAGWLSNLDQHDEATNAAARALELAPENVAVLSQAGQVYFHAGKRCEALRLLREAVRRGLGVRSLRHSPALAALRQDPEFLSLLEEGDARTRNRVRHPHEPGGST